MPNFIFAVGAAFSWACAAQFVSRGLAQMPRQHRALHMALGLLVSLLVGTSLLAALASDQKLYAVSIWLVLAGVLTFPVGTGLYYLCGNAFGGRAEFASQFANVKPILSTVFAIIILHETLHATSYLAVAFLFLGLIFFLSGVFVRHFSFTALLLGIALALTWAFGEVFMSLAMHGPRTISATFLALFSGSLVWLCLALPPVVVNRKKLDFSFGWLKWFAAHGVLSFCIAYALFFESIARIGLSRSILINAFWPPLAILVRSLIDKKRGRKLAIPWTMIVAATSLLTASLIQIVSSNYDL